MKLPPTLPAERKATLFAFGGERANSTVYTAAINTLFLREHNRLCGVIETANPQWDDQRVFQVARNINIVQLLKIVIEEYINHISPYWFKFISDPSACYVAAWNRENWIPVEFNLLYRWHSLVPEVAIWKGARVPMADARFNNGPMLKEGLGVALDSAGTSLTWRLGLFNTADMLRPVELASVQQGRANRLACYNDYREIMMFPRIETFEQISSDPDIVAALKRLYGDVDRIEFFVGIFAEDRPDRSAVPPLIGRMVALDAFSHALTNPLLSPHVFKKETFTSEGWASIAQLILCAGSRIAICRMAQWGCAFPWTIQITSRLRNPPRPRLDGGPTCLVLADGDVADAGLAAQAYAFAEAAIDLARVERVRLELTRRFLALSVPDACVEDRTAESATLSATAVTKAAVADVIRQLAKLVRYERRARARRRKAARAFTDRFLDAVQRHGLATFHTQAE